jgi:hypothetical protein
LGAKTRQPQVLVYYDLLERLIDEEENLIFETKLGLFSIITITISDETISLLNIGMSEVKVSGKSGLKQETSHQGTIKVVISTTNTTKFHVRLEISLEDKVYLETYYHHSQADIEVDETMAKV